LNSSIINRNSFSSPKSGQLNLEAARRDQNVAFEFANEHLLSNGFPGITGLSDLSAGVVLGHLIESLGVGKVDGIRQVQEGVLGKAVALENIQACLQKLEGVKTAKGTKMAVGSFAALSIRECEPGALLGLVMVMKRFEEKREQERLAAEKLEAAMEATAHADHQFSEAARESRVKPTAKEILLEDGAPGLSDYLDANPQSPERIQGEMKGYSLLGGISTLDLHSAEPTHTADPGSMDGVSGFPMPAAPRPQEKEGTPREADPAVRAVDIPQKMENAMGAEEARLAAEEEAWQQKEAELAAQMEVQLVEEARLAARETQLLAEETRLAAEKDALLVLAETKAQEAAASKAQHMAMEVSKADAVKAAKEDATAAANNAEEDSVAAAKAAEEDAATAAATKAEKDAATETAVEAEKVEASQIESGAARSTEEQELIRKKEAPQDKLQSKASTSTYDASYTDVVNGGLSGAFLIFVGYLYFIFMSS